MANDQEKILAQIIAWRNDLIGMSRRNKLLYFSHTKSSSLEVIHPDSSTILELLESRKHRVDFQEPPTENESTHESPTKAKTKAHEIVAHARGDENTLVLPTPQRLRKILRNLRRAASQEYLDKGIQSLYLAFGVLKWFDAPGQNEPCYAPLWLLPVQLQKDEVTEPERLYRLVDEDATINPALAIRLESDFGLTLPRIEEYDELDVLRFEDDVRALVARYPQWEVQDRVILGRFAFHKDVMYRDLLENEAMIVEHEFVQALVDNCASRPDYSFEEPPDDLLDAIAPPEEMNSSLDADASQRRCIWAAAQGRSFVMDGPPGTGKSQTIANMISKLMAQGKTILFVSEKAAALEVVYKRLQAKSLHEYILQLHSHKATRKEVASELGRALERRPAQKERMSKARLELLKLRRKELTDYATAMNEIRVPFGRSLHWAIGRLAQLSDIPSSEIRIKIDKQFDEPQLHNILAIAKQLERAWGPVKRRDRFLWHDLCLTTLDSADRKALEEALKTVHGLLLDIESTACRTTETLALPTVESVVQARDISAVVHLLSDSQRIPATWLTLESHQKVKSCIGKIEELTNARNSAEHAARAKLGEDIEIDSLKGLNAKLHQVLDAVRASILQYTPAAETTMGDIQKLVDDCQATEERVGAKFLDQLTELCVRFDVGQGRLDVQLASAALELFALADSPERPESEWLDASQLAAVREARRALADIIESYRTMHDKLCTVFNDRFRELPAADLALRFTTLYRGMGRIRPIYWQDRKLLKAACRLGKITPEAISMLTEVADFQRTAARLQELEHEHGAKCASYYSGIKTDFVKMDQAIQVADSALQAVSRRLELAGALPYIARGVEVDAQTRLLIGSVQERLGLIKDFATNMLGTDILRIEAMSVSEALDALQKIHHQLSGLLSITDDVDRHGGHVSSLQDLIEGLDSAAVVHEKILWLESKVEEHRAILGHCYAGFDTETSDAKAGLKWARRLLAAIGQPVELRVAETMLAAKVSPEKLDRELADWAVATKVVCRVFEKTQAKLVLETFEMDFVEANEYIANLSRTMDDIEEWIAFASALQGLRHAGKEDIAMFCVRTEIDSEQVASVVERRILETWVDQVISFDKERLGSLRSLDREAIVREFQELDQEIVRTTAGAIMEVCNARRPRTALGSAAIIQREAQKKKRHMPIRNLLKQTQEAAQALKPCFMMSPLSVSQFLEPTITFDVVIFDEASQIRPHDAINCIYRGLQHIVAGDQQQLPPTSFFDAQADDGDEWEDDQLEQYESLLDKVKASASVRSLPLLWHYRSQHEDLITFSNASFYDGRLITFPSPNSPGPTLGVGFNLVEGIYRRGAQRDNLVEARKVAEIVGRYARDYPGFSIGVVAFSKAQEETIENAISELRAKDAALPTDIFSSDRLDGFFVKNLESVQGDERDIIILSIGYGRDENAKLTMTFGPINAAGGYRRLNVAVTRARLRLELVTSIRAQDISENIENEGVRHLRRYLEYAEHGPSCLAFDGPESLGDVESPFEAEVARVIRSWGYEVVPQVGCAGYRLDLGIRDSRRPGGFAIGIECDGAAYHSSKTARDRDRLREEVLKGLGWRLYRIWGPAWYRQRQAEELRLREAIEQSISGGEVASDLMDFRHAESFPTIFMEDFVLASTIVDAEWLIPYEIASPSVSPMDRSVKLGDPSAQPVLWRVIPEVVRTEEPIHKALLIERIKDAWGTGRAGNRIQDNFEAALKYLTKKQEIKVDKSGFIRLSGLPAGSFPDVVRQPVPGRLGTLRTAQQISQDEIIVAVRKCSDLAPGITREDLSSEVAAIFGWARRGSEVAAVIDKAIDYVQGELA